MLFNNAIAKHNTKIAYANGLVCGILLENLNPHKLISSKNKKINKFRKIFMQ